MKFRRLLEIVSGEPIFETGLLLSGNVDPAHVRRQLARWKREGKVLQLRRGLYALTPPYRKRVPHPFLVANLLVRASYVSTESALALHGLIPEHVPVTTSVTTGRPGRRATPLGDLLFRHVKRELLWGYRRIEVAPEQHALVALPEKALLDLVHLRPGGDRREFLAGLRLQNLEELDLDLLRQMAARTGRPKLARAAAAIADLAREEAGELAREQALR